MRTLFMLLFVLCLVHTFNVRGQFYLNQNKKWAFGFNAGLDFNTTALPSSWVSAITFFPSPNNGFRVEGTASVSDTAGNLLFYCTGNQAWTKTNTLMPNATNMITLGASSSTQGTLIVPVLSNPSQYYVFTIENLEEYVYNAQPLSPCIFYCIVDMTLNGGLGDVVPGSSVRINTKVSEKMIAIPGNDCNIWVLTHSRDDAKFMAYNISASGVDTTPVISSAGGLTGVLAYTSGVIKVSPDRKKIAVTSNYAYTTSAYTTYFTPGLGVELCDFDPATGIVSNARLLQSTLHSYYGAAFSPDNTKLYVNYAELLSNRDIISQWDVSLPTTAAIIASKFDIVDMTGCIGRVRDMKLAPDGKIYFPSLTNLSAMGCIDFPNLAGAAASYTASALVLATGSSNSLGLPNEYVVPIAGDTQYHHKDTSVCASGSGFAYTFHAPQGRWHKWFDGTTDTVHTFSVYGTYWVGTQTECSYRIDTLTLRPVKKDTTICMHDTVVCADNWHGIALKASAAMQYHWDNDDSGQYRSINKPGTYWVAGQNDCRITIDTFEVISREFSISVAGGDTVCPGIPAPIKIKLLGAVDILSINWSPAMGIDDTSALSTSFRHALSGTYKYNIAIKNTFGCTASDSIKFYVSPPADIDVIPAKVTIKFGQTIQLTASQQPGSAHPYKYYWMPNDGSLDNNNINNPFAQPLTSTTYTVVAMNYFGCRDTAYADIYIDYTEEDLPTAFTPNGDGKNDFFGLVNSEYTRLIEFSIYNRWGERIYHNTTDATQGWDGKFKGVPQDLGVYFYMIIAARPDGKSKIYKGDVTLVR